MVEPRAGGGQPWGGFRRQSEFRQPDSTTLLMASVRKSERKFMARLAEPVHPTLDCKTVSRPDVNRGDRKSQFAVSDWEGFDG